jgi:hypothetical protein
LTEFNNQNAVPTAKSISQSLSPSRTPSEPSSEDEFHPPKPNGPRSKHLAQQLDFDSLAGKLETKQLNTEFLENLLRIDQLQTECQQLEVTTGILTRPTEFRLATESARNIASRIVDQIERHNELSTLMYFEMPAATSESGTWGERLASLTLTCIADIGVTVPNMVALTQIHDLVARGVQAQVCRSLIAVYQWLVHLGPSLATQLASIHREDGVEALSQKFPQLAPMVDHIFTYVHDHQTWQQQQKQLHSKTKKGAIRRGRGRTKTRKVGQPATPVAAADNNPDPSSSAPSLISKPTCRVPADLWGLIPTAKATATIALEQLSASVPERQG